MSAIAHCIAGKILKRWKCEDQESIASDHLDALAQSADTESYKRESGT
jgi:hypothetical protein